MSGRLPYKKRQFYPHMTGEDSTIWDRFVVKFPKRFETVDYDFRVGEGQKIDPESPDNFKRMATMLSQKRIDALGWVGEHPTIVEVKSRVGLSALGQVMGYKTLFEMDHPDIDEPDLLVVCERINDDDQAVLKINGVPVEIV